MLNCIKKGTIFLCGIFGFSSLNHLGLLINKVNKIMNVNGNGVGPCG
jgi:hypothetical protein